MAPDPKSFLLTDDVHRYLVAHGTPPDKVQEALIAATRELGGVSGMQIAPEQGAFMTVLARLVGARRAIEIGTFTGYSALCVARGLAEGGRLLCCDVNEDWTSVGRRFWEQAGVADRIELRLGPALDTLRALPAGTTFDFAFIDADKGNYGAYYDEVLARLEPNGVVLVDNVLWGGGVLDDSQQDDDVRAIRAFNDRVAADPRVDTVMLPVADGLTLIRKHP